MTAEFPSFFNSQHRAPPTELSTFDQDLNVQDYVKIDFSHWRYPYVVNGVPISDTVRGCCAPDPCCCRSDVIFYDGKAYDQKPYIAGRLRTRPGDVMYLEGKLVPPFNPGKSVSVYGSIKSKNKRPLNMCSSHKQAGRRLSRSCNSTISKNCATPYYVNGLAYAYSRLGLPYGETIGYFRFKPDKVCDCRDVSVQYLEDCCTCEPGESNAALYVQDDCPARECCC